MIHVAEIRADAQSAPGDAVVLTKEQIFALLDEIDLGHAAMRELKFRDATAQALGIDRVSDAT